MENEPENKVPEWDRGAVMERAIGKAKEAARKTGDRCKVPNPFIAYLRAQISVEYGTIEAFLEALRVTYGWTVSKSCVYSWLRGAKMPSAEHRKLLQELFDTKCAEEFDKRADKVKAKTDRSKAAVLEQIRQTIAGKSRMEALLFLQIKRAKLESSLDHDLLTAYRRGQLRLRLRATREVIRDLQGSEA